MFHPVNSWANDFFSIVDHRIEQAELLERQYRQKLLIARRRHVAADTKCNNFKAQLRRCSTDAVGALRVKLSEASAEQQKACAGVAEVEKILMDLRARSLVSNAYKAQKVKRAKPRDAVADGQTFDVGEVMPETSGGSKEPRECEDVAVKAKATKSSLYNTDISG